MVKQGSLPPDNTNGYQVFETIRDWQWWHYTAPTDRGPGQLSKGGKSASEPVPRAIVVYPASLSPPLVDIPPRRSRILIPRCRFGILHTCIYCTLDGSSRNINMHPLAIHLRPLVSGFGIQGWGFCWSSQLMRILDQNTQLRGNARDLC